jgi:hypothetical protein
MRLIGRYRRRGAFLFAAASFVGAASFGRK